MRKLDRESANGLDGDADAPNAPSKTATPVLLSFGERLFEVGSGRPRPPRSQEYIDADRRTLAVP